MCDHDHEHDHEHEAGHIHEHEEDGWLPLIALGAVLALGVALRLLYGLIPLSNLLLIGVMVASGLEVAKKGLGGLRRGSININLLMTVAAIGATLIGHLEEGASVVFLFNVAERLDSDVRVYWYCVQAVNMESVHDHNVCACVERRR